MKSFSISDCIDHYVVMVHGNELVYSNSNKKPALRKFNLYKRKSVYVELFYCNSSGNLTLLDYAN